MSKASIRASVFAKGALALATCIALVAGTQALLSYHNAEALGRSAIAAQAQQVTGLLTKVGGGPIKFAKPDPLRAVFAEAQTSAKGALQGALAIGAGKTVLTRTDAAAGEMDRLALAALAEARPQTSADGLTVAYPVFYGTETQPVGAIATSWSADGLGAVVRANLGQTLSAAALVSALVLAAAVFLLRRTLSQPLNRLSAALHQIAGGDYRLELPSQTRGDEVGAIASAVAELRDRLGAGEAAQVEASYKSAAFEGSSAAMMVIDEAHVVRYTNPAMVALMQRLTPYFRRNLPDFDAHTAVGRSLDQFLRRHEGVRRKLFDERQASFEEVVALDDFRIALRLSPVQSAAGETLGRVVEWADVTAQVLNAAVLEAINADQARAEFSADGQLTSCNARFAEALGHTPETLRGQALSQLLAPQWVAAAPERSALLEAVTRNGPMLERFSFASGTGPVTLEASLACVRDPSGKAMRYLLLGRDITADTARLEAAEAARSEMQRAQGQVVEALSVALTRMRDGDLSQRIGEPFAPDYEALRADYNGTMDTLSTTMRELVEAATGIHNEARDISTTADTLSRRTESTAATLEETAAALDQLTNSVRAAAEGAGRADREVSEAQSRAEKSGEIVMETVEAMDRISSFSEKITSITKVIEDIAFQTNLLALNAGVEAARAGEAGRGFAVVASEVRALAQRCSEAAREINELIADSGAHVQRGVDLVGQTGAALKEIVQSIAGIAGLVSDIAGSARQQSLGLAEINTAMNDLDQSTQENAARLEEATAASQSLTDDAMLMVETVGHFRLGGPPARSLRPAGAALPEPATPPAASREAETWAAVQRAPGRVEEKAAGPAPERRPEEAPPVFLRRAQAAAAPDLPAADADGWSDY